MPNACCNDINSTQKSAEVTLKALSLGAVDFIPKPSNYSSELENVENEIITKVLNAAKANVFFKKVILQQNE